MLLISILVKGYILINNTCSSGYYTFIAATCFLIILFNIYCLWHVVLINHKTTYLQESFKCRHTIIMVWIVDFFYCYIKGILRYRCRHWELCLLSKNSWNLPNYLCELFLHNEKNLWWRKFAGLTFFSKSFHYLTPL